LRRRDLCAFNRYGKGTISKSRSIRTDLPAKIARIEFILPQSAQIKAPPLKSAKFTSQTVARNFNKISSLNSARDL